MKKAMFAYIIAIVIITFIIVCIFMINLNSKNKQSQIIKNYNLEYEQYLNKQVYGTDVASLISKAVNQNIKNNVQKDEKGHFINNDENSIKIDLKMITIDKTYPMEEIYNNEISNFVQNFNLIMFKSIEVQYHKKTGRISKIVFEEQI